MTQTNSGSGANTDARLQVNDDRNYRSILAGFVDAILAVSKTHPVMLIVAEAFAAHSAAKVDKLLQEKAEKVDDEKGTWRIPQTVVSEFAAKIKESRRSRLACSITRDHVIPTIVEQYDCYLGRILRRLLSSNPRIILSPDRTLPVSEILGCISLDDIRDRLVDKEIDSILRQSHDEQVEWLEKKLKITVRSDFPRWSKFVEVTERRNLLVHTGGRVSKQYLDVCGRHKDLSPLPPLGTKLAVDMTYFDEAWKCVLEFGVKLGDIVWRKTAPAEANEADRELNNAAVELIEDGEHVLAERIIDFALNLRAPDRPRSVDLMLRVNRVQALKWRKSPDFDEALKQIDWDGLDDSFMMARALLLDDFDSAADLMLRLKKDELAHACRWPLAREFRKTETFKNQYARIFGQEWAVEDDEVVPTWNQAKRDPANSAESVPRIAPKKV